MSIRPILAAALVATVLTGCGADEPDSADASVNLHRIDEPWQPEPFAVEAPIVAAIDRACAAIVTPRGLPLAVVDVRGGSRAMLLYAGPKDATDCTAEIRPDGRIQLVGGGASGSSDPFGRPVGGAVSLLSFGASGESSSVIGQAGPAVQRVIVTMKTGRQMRASIGPTGWFVAWWPGGDEFLNATGFDAAGAQTGTAQ